MNKITDVQQALCDLSIEIDELERERDFWRNRVMELSKSDILREERDFWRDMTHTILDEVRCAACESGEIHLDSNEEVTECPLYSLRSTWGREDVTDVTGPSDDNIITLLRDDGSLCVCGSACSCGCDCGASWGTQHTMEAAETIENLLGRIDAIKREGRRTSPWTGGG
jgi:hypothetical protein